MTAVPIEVRLLRSTASDADVATAARVSTDPAAALGAPQAEINGLIRYLLRKRHGSPFEQNYFQFYVKAPIFVFREFMRHRIGFSYNEMSGRYVQLPEEFYFPPAERPLVQEGSSAHPKIVPGNGLQRNELMRHLYGAYDDAWETYLALLELGIAKEVARLVLPVGIMSQMVVSCNARSLMAFLSLRVDDPDATFETKPQWEIDHLVARPMEQAFAQVMPLTHAAFIEYGRVAP